MGLAGVIFFSLHDKYKDQMGHRRTRQNVYIKFSLPTLTCVRIYTYVDVQAFVGLRLCRFVSFFLTVFRIILVEMNMCSLAATMRIVVIYWIVFEHI